MTRMFYILHSLSKNEQQKALEARRNPNASGTPVITYRRKRQVKDIDLLGLTVDQWAADQCRFVIGMNDPFMTRYVTVFGACEAKDGECCRKLEDAWNAEQMELIP